jgi:Tfp pilus assembly protein PilV
MSRSRVFEGRREGFSLVETVVAMLVGTIALVALAGVMVSTSQVQALSLSRMELTAIGETKLDELRAHSAFRSADTVQLAIGGSLTSNVANHAGQITSARGRVYNVRWTVAAGLNGTRDVVLRVSPASERRNEVPYVDLRTLMLLE